MKNLSKGIRSLVLRNAAMNINVRFLVSFLIFALLFLIGMYFPGLFRKDSGTLIALLRIVLGLIACAVFVSWNMAVEKEFVKNAQINSKEDEKC